jgi:hypothetical protein
MDSSNAGVPSEVEKQRFMKKIIEWKSQGFDTENLEYLLENDFNEFLRKRHKILKEQLPDKEPPTGVPADEIITDEHPPDTETEPHEFEPVPESPDEPLLIGEPLAPEDEVAEEPDEESLIVVGKPKRIPRSKVHPSRKEKPPETVTEDKKGIETEPEEIDEDVEEPEALEDEEEEEPEEVEEEEMEEEESEEPEVSRKRLRPPPAEKPSGGSVGGRIVGAIVIMILILSLYYFGIVNPIIDFNGDGNGGGGNGNGGNGGGDVQASFTISPVGEYFAGSVITLDASNSTGDIIKYGWNVDDDFKIVEGSLQKVRLKGYYSASENIENTITIILTVSSSDKDDTTSKSVTFKPRSFIIDEERSSDLGKYLVTGSLDISNPNGIFTFEDENFKITVQDVNIDFQTKDQPMEMLLETAPNIEDGFRQNHVIVKRSIIQYLDITGTVRVKPEIKNNQGGTTPIPAMDADLEGNMDTTDTSYTDLTTHNTIFGKATNDMNITILPISFGIESFDGASFTSNDIVESYPDLRKNPMKFRLQDLTDEPLELGDGDVLPVGEIIYHWDAEKIDYYYNEPAIEVNMSIDGDTKDYYKLTDFYSAFWIAEGISQPVRTHLHTVHVNDGNTTVLNYISEMTDYTRGVTKLETLNCNLEYSSDSHFMKRTGGYTYVSPDNWTFLPPTGSSVQAAQTSFEGFTAEDAMALAKTHQPFINYNTSNPDVYVIDAHCTSSGTDDISEGTLFWELTFGTKDKKQGLKLTITENGSVDSETVSFDPEPPNSTSEFDPLLTFAGSEDILQYNFSDKDFSDVIFKNNQIDFNNVKYGIETNLLYPNVEITSIMFVEHSKYAYLVTFEQQISNEEHLVSVALDAETGQLLFYWDHTDTGFNLLEMI